MAISFSSARRSRGPCKMFRKGASKDKVKKKGDGGGKPKPQTPPPAGDDKPAVSNMKTMLPIVSQIDGARPREMTDKLAAKVKRCVRGKMMPDHLTDRVTVDVQWGQARSVGAADQRRSRRNANVTYHSGDILVQCNDFHFTGNLQNNTGFLKALTKKGKKTARFEVIRLKRKVPVDWSLLPGFTKQEGMEYHQVYLYNYKGMQVGLDVRMIEDPEMNRVFVERVRDKSAAAVCLGFGDRIIEHSGRMVTNVQDLLSALQTELNEKGWTRMTVEVPVSDPCRCFVRNKLLVDPFGLPTEGGMPPRSSPASLMTRSIWRRSCIGGGTRRSESHLALILRGDARHGEKDGIGQDRRQGKASPCAHRWQHPSADAHADDQQIRLGHRGHCEELSRLRGRHVVPQGKYQHQGYQRPAVVLSVMPSFLQTARNPVKSTMQPTKKG
ncbi:unnamed protein product, partial [Mesorhabditis spiculigera]